MKGKLGVVGVVVSGILAVVCGCAGPAGSGSQQKTVVEPVAYHGWPGALRLRNRSAEVVIAPEVGRVMSFRFLDGENVFWEDRSLDGQHGDWGKKEWINFGGDKSWPAPEAEWGKYTHRSAWQPPPAFDSMACEARVEGNEVVLTSPVDPYYAIRVTRRIRLDHAAPVLRIKTTYERVSGTASRVSIWVITQFGHPEGVYFRVPAASLFTNGYYQFPGERWDAVRRVNSLVEVTRDARGAYKLATDADRVLWVGAKEMCLVESPRVAEASYPDAGASAEVYTNPDPKKYVEVEMLGPLTTLKRGETMSRESRYTLMRRGATDAVEDAHRVLHR